MIFEDEVLDEVKEREHKKDAAPGESVDEVEEILRNDFDEKIEEQGEKFDEKLEKLEEMFNERLEKLEEKTESELKKLSKVLRRLEDQLDRIDSDLVEVRKVNMEELVNSVAHLEGYVGMIYDWDYAHRNGGPSFWEKNTDPRDLNQGWEVYRGLYRSIN